MHHAPSPVRLNFAASDRMLHRRSEVPTGDRPFTCWSPPHTLAGQAVCRALGGWISPILARVTLRLGIFGRGRLGSLIADAATRSGEVELCWTLGREGAPEVPVDVAIDVSHADAVPAHLAWAQRTGTDLVIGATGWTGRELEDPQPGIGILLAPNFSLSVALLRRLATVLGGYAAQAPEPVDLAVCETHHRAKVDAPSGTAVMLRSALSAASGRREHEIGTTSLRLGNVVGEHIVRYESAGESIELRHASHTREVYATGALTAARWLHGRTGVHDVQDWADESLQHLFDTTPGAATTTPTSTSSSHTP